MIQIRYSKTVLADPDLQRRLATPMAVAQATARVMYERVGLRGDSTTSAPPYPTGTPMGKNGRERKYRIAGPYAEKLGLKELTYTSSAQFHQRAHAQPGSANVTGGMWAGLQVRNYGATGAVINFAGSSQGSSTPKGEVRYEVKKPDGSVQRGRMKVSGFGLQGKSRAEKKAHYAQKLSAQHGGQARVTSMSEPSTMVRNQDKAAIVFSVRKIGVLQPTPAEAQAQVAAVSYSLGLAVFGAFKKGGDRGVRGSDVKAGLGNLGDPRLFNMIVATLPSS